jgi:hypothetical protein
MSKVTVKPQIFSEFSGEWGFSQVQVAWRVLAIILSILKKDGLWKILLSKTRPDLLVLRCRTHQDSWKLLYIPGVQPTTHGRMILRCTCKNWGVHLRGSMPKEMLF